MSTHRDTRRTAAAVAVLTSLILAGSARGDGMFLASPTYWMLENRQAALLEWDGDTGTEALTIQPGFIGDARSFVWIVPTPSDPVVTAADSGLFADIRRATAPLIHGRANSWDCGREEIALYAAGQVGPVETVFRDLVGDYDVTVVHAAEAGALADTLTAWGYLDPDTRAVVEPVLQDYVTRGWAFVTARIDTDAVTLPPDSHWFDGTGLTPLTMTFAAGSPVYPMRLSQLSAAASSSVDLTLIADHRWEAPGLDPIYANRVDAGELAELGVLAPRLAARLAPGRFVTRFYGYLGPVDMTDDIGLVQAPDDAEFRRVSSAVPLVTGLLFLVPTAFWYGRRLRPGRRT